MNKLYNTKETINEMIDRIESLEERVENHQLLVDTLCLFLIREEIATPESLNVIMSELQFTPEESN